MTASESFPIAVIADIVGSRRLEDRAQAQRSITEAFMRASPYVHALERPHETVGDEFQAVFATTTDALVFTTLVPLALDPGIELRFGLGAGAARTVTPSGLQDGPGWWAARAAIDEASKRQHSRFPSTRSWFQDGTRQDGIVGSLGPRPELEALTNAYLMGRDATIARLGQRERRWTFELWAGRSQRHVAEADGVTQPAVSQVLTRAGATHMIEGLRLMQRGAR
jgi:hypothetical protein